MALSQCKGFWPFYLNYVECKLIRCSFQFSFVFLFYLNYVECKSYIVTLIEANVNAFYLNYVECKFLRLWEGEWAGCRFYLNYVECKLMFKLSEFLKIYCFIWTMWNVNECCSDGYNKSFASFIWTMWNVNEVEKPAKAHWLG